MPYGANVTIPSQPEREKCSNQLEGNLILDIQIDVHLLMHFVFIVTSAQSGQSEYGTKKAAIGGEQKESGMWIRNAAYRSSS